MLPPRRIAELLLLFALPAIVLTTGCTRTSQAEAQRGTAVVIFVDFSESIGGTDRAGFKREIEKQERVVVGLNRFQVKEPKPTNLLRVDPTVRLSQMEKIKRLKAALEDRASALEHQAAAAVEQVAQRLDAIAAQLESA